MTAVPYYYTLTEAAERLDVSYHTARSMVVKGELPHLRLGKLIRVPREAIDDVTNDSKIPDEAVAPNIQRRRDQLAEELQAARRLNTRERVRAHYLRDRNLAVVLQSERGCKIPTHLYPDVPAPMVQASNRGDGLPAVSGVYFVWDRGRVVYVGKSINLQARACANKHHVITTKRRLSWLEFDVEVLNWAECFYIGVLCPRDNFGGV